MTTRDARRRVPVVSVVATRAAALLAAGVFALAVAGMATAQQPDAGGQGQGQEPGVHHRPEQGDQLPEITVTDAGNGAKVALRAALQAPPTDAPLVIAFVHKDKDLCVRFVDELGKQVGALGDDGKRCAIHLVFCGEDHDGAAVAAAKKLSAPFHLGWDLDRSAYERLGLIAFPTAYVVDRKTGAITLLRRGYKLTLAQEVTGRLEVGLGRITQEELLRRESGAAEVPSTGQEHETRLRLARQLLHTGKAEAALAQFEAMVAADPKDAAARAGVAMAAGKLGRGNALDLLRAAHRNLPDDAEVALALGEALLAADDLDAAEPLIRSALTKAPAPAWFALGLLHERRSNWKEAALAYREAASRLLH